MKLATLCYVQDIEQKKTLMLHRVKKNNDFHEGKWNGLGGKLENGESPEDCAIREIFEESGLQVNNPKMSGFITFPNFDGIDDWYVFLFTVDNYSGTLIDSPEGDLKWVPDAELLQLNLWEGDKVFLPWVLAGNFFSAKFVYTNKKLVDYTVTFINDGKD
ncbi:MAG: 8-oxo-dGTP diphosphatase [Ignavibacteria bacterium]|nr:8-oxo-dGTP diphosphatase [Ignavibacteria bacterium]